MRRLLCELYRRSQGGLVAWMMFAFCICLATTAYASEFSGRFDGIGTSTGMVLTLQEADGRVVGRFDTGRGEAYTLNGRRTGEAAQGSVERGNQVFFFHVEKRPLGLQFLLIPRGPDNGPDIAGATDYSFVQQGLQLPRPSQYKTAPPQGVPVDVLDFIDGFRDWSPADMARTYAGLDDRYREVILLFDHAAAEVLWRVCSTNPPNSNFSAEDLSRLLDRQNTDCADYLRSVEVARKDGLLGEFVRKSNFQFELVRETVKCDRNLSPETKCADVGAMSSPLMLRWRRAKDLMIALSDPSERGPTPARSGQAVVTPDAMAPIVSEPVPLAAPLRGSIASTDPVELVVTPGRRPEDRGAGPEGGEVPLPQARPRARADDVVADEESRVEHIFIEAEPPTGLRLPRTRPRFR